MIRHTAFLTSDARLQTRWRIALFIIFSFTMNSETSAQGAQDDDPRPRPPRVETALADLQERITAANERQLDGILLQDAYFNDRGELVFVGVRSHYESSRYKNLIESQTARLREILAEFCSTRWAEANARMVKTKQNPDGINLDELRAVANLPLAIQQMVAQNEEYDGVRIDRHFYKDKKLHIRGIQGNDSQQEQLEKYVQEQLASVERWKELPYAKVELDLRTVPIDKFRREMQRFVASRPVLDGTRIDRAYFDELGRVAFRGIRWGPTTAAPPTRGQTPRDQLIYDELFSRVSRSPLFTDGAELNLQPLVVVRSPIAQWRGFVARDRRLDGVRIDRVYYAFVEERQQVSLTVQGVFDKQTEAQRALLIDVGKDNFSSLDWRVWTENAPPRAELVAVDYDQMVAKLQARIRGARRADGKLVDKARIDRVHFDQKNVLQIEGVRWSEHAQSEDPLAQRALQRLVAAELKSTWTDVVSSETPEFSINGVVKTSSALAFVRQIVSQNHDLDGVRVDVAYYDGRGQLHFAGAQRHAEQVGQLADAIRARSRETSDWTRWTTRRWREKETDAWSIDALEVTPTQELLLDLRAKAMEDFRLDGLRIDRLHYDEQLRLALIGQFWEPWQPELLKSILHSLIENNWRRAVRHADGSRVTDDADLPDGYTIETVVHSPSLLTELRNEVARRCELDGTRLDRAYYDIHGVLNFKGLLGHAEHKARLDKLVALYEQNESWDAAFVAGFSTANEPRLRRFRVAAMDKLLTYVQESMPAYTELDGASVVRAYYALPLIASDDEQIGPLPLLLSLEGRVADEPQRDSLQKIVSQLTSNDKWAPYLQQPALPTLAEASQRGVDVNRMTKTQLVKDPYNAQRLFGEGYGLYRRTCYPQAIEQFDLAMAYDSSNVSSWYYRALCYIALQRNDLARRDVRRAVLLEQQGEMLQGFHFGALSSVQGRHRLCFERLRFEAQYHRPSGKKIANACAEGACDRCGNHCCSPCCPKRLEKIVVAAKRFRCCEWFSFPISQP